jgi:hypothetical protein
MWAKEEEVTGWRKLCNEELNNLFFVPKIIRKIKSKTKRSAKYVASIERR